MEWHRSQRRALGLSIQLPEAALREGYQPLACMGLPPRSRKWEPVPAEPHEGHISMAAGRDLFGDGSGLNQSSREGALATWAVTRLERDGPVEAPRDVKLVEAARGRVAGWFQTVPRAELSAMEFALRHMAIDGRYIGDCAFALEGAALGVPLHLRAAGSFNADLWRLIHRRIEDIGPQVGFKKTKAHRSMAAAEVDPHDGVWYWHGNQHADAQCKNLVKTIERQDGGPEQADMMEATAVAVFRLVSSSVTWAFRNLGDLEPQRRKSKQNKRAGRGSQEQMVGQHAVAPRAGGGVQCIVCRLCSWSGAGRRWLRQKPCRGELASQIHPSHVLRSTGEMFWCSTCGAYTSRMPRRLLRPCCGGPRSEAQRNVRRRLLVGLPPTTSALHAAVCRAKGDSDGNRDIMYPPLIPRVVRMPIAISSRAVHDVDGYSIDDGGGGNERGTRAQSQPPQPGNVSDAVPPSFYAQRELRRRRRAGSPSGICGPAGGLHEDEAYADEGRVHARANEESHMETRSSSNPHASPRVRLRVTGKQPPRSASQEDSIVTAAKLCKPLPSASWSTRLRAAPVHVPAPCHLCGGLTRTLCKGCHRRVCLTCARTRRECTRER